MSDARAFSQSEIATYLACQRKYRYEYERDVQVAEDTPALEVGRALHETIRETCDRVRDGGTHTDDDIRVLAEDAFRRQWESEVGRDAYRTEAHYEDDRRLARTAIEHFFTDGPGVDHARRSLAAEKHVEFERNGVAYAGYVDNVLETREGLELVDYKKSAIDPPVTSRKNYIELHRDGEYRPRRVKHAIQAVLYMEGVKDTEYYDQRDTVAFTYQPLAEADIDRKGRKIAIEFDTEPDRVGEDIRENREALWDIIEDAVAGIRSNAFDPSPFEEITDEQCDQCPFRSMCSAYLTAEEFKL